jgi:hypothetical protein
VDNRFIRAMGKLDDRFVIVLDMDRVFSVEQLEGLAERDEGIAMPPTKQMDISMPAASS